MLYKECCKYLKKKLKNKKRVKPIPEKEILLICNYKCHLNCLSYAIKHRKAVKHIVGGIQVIDNQYIAHFIVKLKNGNYVDPTYGNVVDRGYDEFIPLKKYSITDFQPAKALPAIKKQIHSYLPKKLRNSIDYYKEF